MRYIVLVLAMSVASLLWAQDYRWTPEDDNTRFEQSIVNPAPAVATEATTTYDIYPTAGQGISGRRNANNSDDPFGGGDITDVPDPDDPKNPNPIGDVPVLMMLLLAAGCAVYIRRKQKSPSQSQQ